MNIDKRADQYNQLYFKRYGVFLPKEEVIHHVKQLTSIVRRLYIPTQAPITLTTINNKAYGLQQSS